MGTNAIRKGNDGWYFADELWADEYGPYKSKQEAVIKFGEYVELLDKKSIAKESDYEVNEVFDRAELAIIVKALNKYRYQNREIGTQHEKYVDRLIVKAEFLKEESDG